ncbi:MAG: putative lipid II flippase FtsW [Candidatus Omnitrophica bacterium]|nr:putative lipid II flippase FtsW [Candidatus Omnitrophota bacterium]
MSSRQRLKVYYKCLIASALLLVLGAAMVLSSSSSYALQHTGDPLYYFKKHCLFFVPGLCLFFFLRRMHYSKLRRYAKLLVLISLVLLILTLIVGTEVKGSKRSISIKGFRFQPSELAKFSLIIYLAHFFARYQEENKNKKVFIIPIAIAGLIMVLLLLEPDFGSTVTVFAYLMGFLIVSGINWLFVPATILSSIPAIIYLIKNKPYMWKRIVAFLNPEQDPLGAGYHVIQALISIGSGGIFGVGLGRGRQKMEFLPEAHKDYVFAVIGEELGFAGCVFVLFLFGIIIFTGFWLSRKIRDVFGRYLAFGISIYFGIQTFLHAGVTMKILPPKGTTLPFFSYGGSSLVVALAILGVFFSLIQNADFEDDEPELVSEIL